jgi:hypothetical protein
MGDEDNVLKQRGVHAFGEGREGQRDGGTAATRANLFAPFPSPTTIRAKLCSPAPVATPPSLWRKRLWDLAVCFAPSICSLAAASSSVHSASLVQPVRIKYSASSADISTVPSGAVSDVPAGKVCTHVIAPYEATRGVIEAKRLAIWRGSDSSNPFLSSRESTKTLIRSRIAAAPEPQHQNVRNKGRCPPPLRRRKTADHAESSAKTALKSPNSRQRYRRFAGRSVARQHVP